MTTDVSRVTSGPADLQSKKPAQVVARGGRAINGQWLATRGGPRSDRLIWFIALLFLGLLIAGYLLSAL